jgi:NADH-quinone oxidoreductase subunit L
MFRLMFLTLSKKRNRRTKHHLHESPLITIPLIVLAILATIGGMISLPGNSWLNHYSNFPKLATAEHHLGTTEYILMAIAVVGGLVGIGIAYAKYIKQNTVLKMLLLQGFSKVL